MENEIEISRYDGPKSWFKSCLLGVLIGLGIIIPGVSGAQIAMLFKLYDKVMYSISNIFKKFVLCFLFLLPIIIGAIIGFLLGFFGIQQLLNLSTFILVAFFAGMILGGIPSLSKEVKGTKINVIKIILFIIGLIIPISISVIAIHSNLDLGNSYKSMPWWMMVIALPIGFVIALTQIIPGLSATSTLISIGLFNPIMDSVHLTYWKENPTVWIFYIMFGLGFLIGLFLFSKLITRIIEKHKDYFYTLAIGLSISSVISMFYNPEIVGGNGYEKFSNFFSGNEVSGLSPIVELSVGIPLFFVGFIAILFVVWFLDKKQKKSIDNNVNIS